MQQRIVSLLPCATEIVRVACAQGAEKRGRELVAGLQARLAPLSQAALRRPARPCVATMCLHLGVFDSGHGSSDVPLPLLAAWESR